MYMQIVKFIQEKTFFIQIFSTHPLFTVYRLQSTVYSLQFTVYSLQSTVYSLQSTVYSLQSTELSKIKNLNQEKNVS